MLCRKDGGETMCRYGACGHFCTETEECTYGKIFPLWMKQLPDHLKQNEELAKFPSIGELAEGYLKIAVR